MARRISDLTFFLVISGSPVFLRRKTKKSAAVKKRKKMRQNGVKLNSAILVATKESPQQITAVVSARYVNKALSVFNIFSLVEMI